MSRNRYSVARAVPLREITTAVLVDGGFYRKRAATLFGHKTAEDRADELVKYCHRHIRESRAGLYRIFYYDCPPSQRVVYHPLLQQQVNLGKSDFLPGPMTSSLHWLKNERLRLEEESLLKLKVGTP